MNNHWMDFSGAFPWREIYFQIRVGINVECCAENCKQLMLLKIPEMLVSNAKLAQLSLLSKIAESMGLEVKDYLQQVCTDVVGT